MGNDQLDPSITYGWKITLAWSNGHGSWAAQEHYGTFRPPKRMRVADAIDEIRRDCARIIGRHISEVKTVSCTFQPQR